MLNNNHEAFFPPQANRTLWRYIDFTKLLSLLETRKLFFARIDTFDDPYEGTWSHESVRRLREDRMMKPQAIENLLKAANDLRHEIFVNSWCAIDNESAAMWKLYLQSPEGVAIQSDHERLARVLDKSTLSIRTTLIKYVDYKTTLIPLRNIFFAVVTKRLSFAHEKELRAVIWSGEDINQPQISRDAASVSIEIEPEELIRAIHVCPTAPQWFAELVEKVVHRYGITCPIIHSDLYNRPLY